MDIQPATGGMQGRYSGSASIGFALGVGVSAGGQVYARTDRRFAFRVLASNGQIVAVDGSQGYQNRVDATATLTHLLAGSYRGGGVTTRVDGKYGFRVTANSGDIVATDGAQGYNNRWDAQATFDTLVSGGYDGPIEQL